MNVSWRARVTRLSRAFEVRSPSRPMRSITPRKSRARTRCCGAGVANTLADSSSRPTPTRSSTSAVRSTMASSSPARMAGALVAADGMALRIGDEAPERQRVDVPVRDQPVVRKDEGDRRGLGPVGVDLRDDGRRHVERAAFLVESARGLDLAHLLARGHVDREQALDRALLGERRLEEVHPDALLRECPPAADRAD